jgi:alkylation response protein AidB-like acyl-CoA dehydrogenase
MDRAIVGGFGSDRLAWAFASGYQAALHALFPGAPEDRIAALCVTEEEGNQPRAIRATLKKIADRYSLTGAKRWTTLGPEGAVFFVAARDADADGARPVLRILRIPSGSRGVKVALMPPTRFVPEVPHAQIAFDGVEVREEDVLPGDGYDEYVKPFRTVEDLHAHAAAIAYLVREARRLAWPRGWIERAASLLHALRALAMEDPTSPATHVAVAGSLAWGTSLVEETEEFWSKAAGDPAAVRWRRDRELLGVAGSARAQRTARAWERLAARP